MRRLRYLLPIPFLLYLLTGISQVDRAVLDKDAWASGVVGTWSAELYVFAGDFRDRARVHARFFAPALGVDEDPATGSACASLAASLAQRSPEPNGTYRLQVAAYDMAGNSGTASLAIGIDNTVQRRR